ncbi:murein biosynthesis integral membrane protein MurJ [Candidatus Berkelbacteria bacterium]|nr:murein biosynthesis integral membrane protein MurJ [Candidatus Berkelbacteria bacterium]
MIERLKQFAAKPNSLAGATVILVVTTLASNVLGLLRDRFFAQKIPTDLLDTYFAAFRLPDLIFNILILGTVSAAFIPVFLEYRAKSERESWHVAHTAISLALVVMIGLAILLFLAMPALVPLLVPDFSVEKQVLTVQLGRILLIQPIFFGLSYLFSGILNALKRFTVYAIAPLIYNLAIIVATVLFADEYGVYALAWGVVVGALLHMALQFVAARMVGYRPVARFDFRSPAIRKILRLMVPRSVGFGAFQLTLVVFTAIASSLGPGAVAAYNFADNIQTMPTAVLGLAFITALYPTLAERVAAKQLSEFARLTWRGLRYLLVALVPAAVGLILLRAQIVRLILGTGHFGWEATITTADTLGAFAVGVVTAVISALLARSFYALHETRLPTLIQIGSFVVAVALGWYLAVPLHYGVPGLAFGLAASTVLYAALLYSRLRVRVPQLRAHESEFWPLMGQLAFGVLVLTLVVQAAKVGVAAFVDMDRFWGVFAQTITAIVAGGGAYWITLSLLRVPELDLLVAVIRSKLGGVRSVPLSENGTVRHN